MLTVLRVMLIVSYVSQEVLFPWWLWLYATVLEFDHFGMDFLHTSIMKFNLRNIQNMEANLGDPVRESNPREKEK